MVRNESPAEIRADPAPFSRPQVNVGNLFGPARAVNERPVFVQNELPLAEGYEEVETIHVALVKIRDLYTLGEEIVNGISQTLSQLAKLSMLPCVIIEEDFELNLQSTRQKLSDQADRLVAALEKISGTRACKVDGIFSVSNELAVPEVQLKNLLLSPLQRGQIPVIVPIAFSAVDLTLTPVKADAAMLALTKEFAGLNLSIVEAEDPYKLAEKYRSLRKRVSLDRIILVDPLGGFKTQDRAHVFINLDQEYEDLQRQLAASKTVESHQNSSNLRAVRALLQFLPSSSSALITHPEDAANLGSTSPRLDPTSGVGTRRQKNALIHNLLTDKPVYSSSLPTGRLSKNGISGISRPSILPAATFVKRGMPLTILPDPTLKAWSPEDRCGGSLKLTDSVIDLPRLVFLIEDSFNRKLDVQHYLDRVNDRIAGIIIVGEYEGGALLTWETPPGADDDDTSRLVPYLDKFAVLKRSQGAGGVADILFNAMVRTCFPNGVCWRSRKNNPVNKWYFERSRGTWKIPDMNWTMFWTTPGVSEGSGLFQDYEAVCRGVEPSWADKKKAAD